jgi:hypothetical protein
VGLFRRPKVDPTAPRGYCAQCGTALVDLGVKEVVTGSLFDRVTGKPTKPERWRTWQCPNQEYVVFRGWIHTSHTDYA